MKTTPLSRRDRRRHSLADLRMPGAFEALDAILQGVNGGTLTAPEAIEQLLSAQIQLRNNRRLHAAMRSSRLPAVKQLGVFGFRLQPSLRREQIESPHELRRSTSGLVARLRRPKSSVVVSRPGSVGIYLNVLSRRGVWAPQQSESVARNRSGTVATYFDMWSRLRTGERVRWTVGGMVAALRKELAEERR